MGGDHSRFLTSVLQTSVLVWKIGSYINLFRPLLLSLFNVPNRHIHRYSCRFNQSSVLVSWVGAWAKIWNLTLLYSWFSCLMWLIIGPSFKCSNILLVMPLVV